MKTKRSMLSPEVIIGFKRLRICEAHAALCAEQGYRATTVADISSRAGVSRATFYECFENKEECFLSVLELALSELFACAEGACRGAEPEQRIEAALAATLDWVAQKPAPAWACFVESTCATPESLRRYVTAITDFAGLLRGNVPTEVSRPLTTEESLIGGVASILRFRIHNGEAQRVPDLLPNLSIFIRAPFMAWNAEAT